MDISKYSEGSFDFEITRVDCIFMDLFQPYLMIVRFHLDMSHQLYNTDTIVCPPVRGDNPRAKRVDYLP